MKKILDLGTKSKFRKNFVKVMSANVGSQFIILACTPLLTRIFTPEQFGLAALFIAVLDILTAICVWKFDRAIPNSRSNTHAKLLTLSGFSFLIVFCSTVLGFFVYLPDLLNQWHGIAALGNLFYLLPIALFFTGIRELLNSWYVKQSDMGPVSLSRWVYSAAYVLGSLILGLIGFTFIGLIAGQIIGLLMCAVTLLFFAKTLYRNSQRLSLVRFARTTAGAVRFTTQSAIVALINRLSFASTVLILAQLFSADQVGQYSLVTRLVITPVTAITAALALSFWARAAELAREKSYAQLEKLYYKLTMVLAGFALVVVLACFVGTYFLVPLLGSQWVGTELVLLATIPFICGAILFSSTNHLFVLDMQGLQYIADIGRIILLLVCFYLSHYHQLGFVMTVLMMSLASFVAHIALFLCHVYAYRRLVK